MSRHTETKDSILKKWWFWLILLMIVVVIAFVVIMWRAFSIVLDEIGTLAIDIQNIYEDATVYTSAGDNTIIIELRNWNDDYSDELEKIGQTVKSKINRGELSSYSKLVMITYIEVDNIEEALFVRSEYDIPEFEMIQESQQYIVFDEYENLLNSFKNLY